MWSAVIKAVSAVVCWFFSERRSKYKEAAERRKAAEEIARGDEEKVNARIAKVTMLLACFFLFLAGCVVERTVYVREGDKALALHPGSVHTNTGESVEWILPGGVMTRLLNAAEAK